MMSSVLFPAAATVSLSFSVGGLARRPDDEWTLFTEQAASSCNCVIAKGAILTFARPLRSLTIVRRCLLHAFVAAVCYLLTRLSAPRLRSTLLRLWLMNDSEIRERSAL